MTPNLHAGHPHPEALVESPQWLKNALSTIGLPTLTPAGMAHPQHNQRRPDAPAFAVIFMGDMSGFFRAQKDKPLGCDAQLLAGKKYGNQYGTSVLFTPSKEKA
jgi:hypothetical protein